MTRIAAAFEIEEIALPDQSSERHSDSHRPQEPRPLLPQPDHPIAFLKGFLERPKQVGSIIPSSRWMERRITRTAELASAMMSLPASRGFEIGQGFAATRMRGSGHNDPFFAEPRDEGGFRVRTRTNHSGGIQGGISNGEALRFAVAFKPVATIFRPQETVTPAGESRTFVPSKGRHDPCVLPRAVPMVEAMTALVLCDAMLRRAGVRVEELR